MAKKLTIKMDRLDYKTLRDEIKLNAQHAKDLGCKPGDLLPDGDSCPIGALIAECIRSLNDYRFEWNNRRGRAACKRKAIP